MVEAAAGGSRQAAHPRTRLDDNFASPIRFSLMASLSGGVELDFRSLAEILQVGDSALSKAIAHLQSANYVKVRKGYVDTRARTWVRSTSLGVAAFARHLEALREIVALGDGQSF